MSSDRGRLRALPALPGGTASDASTPGFGALLRRFRRAAGLTQEQLAERTGLSVAGISGLERGAKASPQRETVRLLVEALALTPDEGRRLVAAVAPRQPPIAAKATRLHPAEGLPPLPGPLIGRGRELAELAGLLADPACRLVTLTGPGGIGKTCLAIQAAADGGGRFAGGAAFVALAPVRSAALLAPAIADALGLPLHGQREPHDQLLDALRGLSALLVLDNFEHLLDGAPLVAAILRHAPALKIIVTSRERLRLQEEWVVAVEGLAVSEEGAAGDDATSDAVRLFVQRARRAQAGFTPGSAEWPHIAHICRLVGGMPLGIELAAAWVPVLPCAEIAREIARNLDFLATAPRDAPGRHRSMRAAFDHSWRLLSAHQRAAFRQLAVFRGGFDRAAAEAVAGASLVTLSALVSKSFLRRTPAGRYAIHELLRQYGAARLDTDPEAARLARGRHCAYFIEFLSRHEGRLRGGEQEAALADIDAELENVRMAWHQAVARRDAALIARAAEGLWLYHTGRGRVWEGEAAFASAVAALEVEPGAADGADTTREAALGMALARQASYLCRLGLYARARGLLDRSVASFRRLDTPRELGFALNILAATVRLEGNYAEERHLLRESLTLLEAAGDRWCAAYSRNDLGLAVEQPVGTDEAARLVRESLAIFAECGDRRGIAFALNNLGELAARRGDYAEAERCHREGLALRRASGDHWGVADSLNQLGRVARLAGSRKAAEGRFLEALEAARAGKVLPLLLDTLVELAILQAEAGDRDRALHVLQVALRDAAMARHTRDTGTKLLARLGVGSPALPRESVSLDTVESVADALLPARPLPHNG